MILINDDNEIKKEAIWALSNCTQHATPSQIISLVQKDGLKGFVSTLELVEAKLLMVSLEGIENVLRAG